MGSSPALAIFFLFLVPAGGKGKNVSGMLYILYMPVRVHRARLIQNAHIAGERKYRVFLGCCLIRLAGRGDLLLSSVSKLSENRLCLKMQLTLNPARVARRCKPTVCRGIYVDARCAVYFAMPGVQVSSNCEASVIYYWVTDYSPAGVGGWGGHLRVRVRCAALMQAKTHPGGRKNEEKMGGRGIRYSSAHCTHSPLPGL